MEDTVSKAYSGWPDRLFIIGADAKIAYAGGRGPWGFTANEMPAALDKMLK